MNRLQAEAAAALDALSVEGLRRSIVPAKGIDFCSNDTLGFTPLSMTGGMCGLADWPAEVINAVGNLAERGYDEDSVKETLEEISKHVPSLKLKVHMGGDNESKDCVATVVLENGKATIEKPELEKIPEVSETQFMGQMMKALTKKK